MLHAGNGDWVIVDSRVKPGSRVPIALEYLAAVGIDASSAVKLIVATHWHDDHVRGLAEVVRSCPGARFVCSAAMGSEEFFTLVEATRTDSMMQSSGVDEFREILSILTGPGLRHPDVTFALGERILYRRAGGPDAEIHSLTPSDQAYQAAIRAIARLLPAPLAPKKRVGPVGPNHASVVISMRVGLTQVLLGADLQEEPGRHWTAVLRSPTRPPGRASVLKIPHHGSSNAHHAGILTDMVEDGALAMLSPFHRGSVTLPTVDDTERICASGLDAYMTAPLIRPRPRPRDRTVEKTINEVVVGRRVVASGPVGHVRARLDIVASNPRWAVELFGPALQICA